jgi:tRNA modification GTPase
VSTPTAAIPGPTPSTTASAINDATIVALATPPGRGAIALVRLSGPRAHAIAGTVLRPWPIAPRHATRCAAVDARGTLLDRPVVIAYDAPRSKTGDPVVEITSHGGTIVPTSIVAALVAAGARPATPGEFTRRAVLNGRMDLAQAEAVGDLIDARSAAMQRSALHQMDGGLSRRVGALREALIGLDALLAYDIDFPEEDDGPIPPARVAAAAEHAAELLESIVAAGAAGELVRDGAVAVIAGAPNVGKSSLFNALLGRARALVTDRPGTTRDAIEAVIEPVGAPTPIRLVDTAGLREASDAIERLGIEVSLTYLGAAHVVLACGETAAGVADAVARIRPHTMAPIIGVRTKSDLAADPGRTRGSAAAGAPLLSVSAESGAGLRELGAALVTAIGTQRPALDAPVVLRARHHDALTRAAHELASFRDAWATRSIPTIVAAVHVRAAIGALDEIVGAISIDDVLDRVFREFCVGK